MQQENGTMKMLTVEQLKALCEARAKGMREAAEIARNFRPNGACTCGNYLSFHNGVPGHQPGCLVGECIDIADEIEGRADEFDRSNRE